jgi:hypothetical protein
MNGVKGEIPWFKQNPIEAIEEMLREKDKKKVQSTVAAVY